jgi:hypothetical protein
LTAGVVPQLDPSIVVFHRRRAFPWSFLAQRWRYREKTGRLLVERRSVTLSTKIAGFLAGGAVVVIGAILFGRRFSLPAAALYAAMTWTMSFPICRRDPKLFPVVPFAFFLHHANYWIATVVGIGIGLVTKAGRSKSSVSTTLPVHPR